MRVAQMRMSFSQEISLGFLKMQSNHLLRWGLLMMQLTWAGCADDGQATIPVSGQITFQGGPCPVEGTITFSPVAVEEGVSRRPGTARFQKDGIFRITSFKEGDGLLPGRYLPLVSCWKGQPDNSDPSSFERLNLIPGNFKADEVVVDRSAPDVKVQIDIPKKN
jgi:hypothetical protein